MDKQAIKIALLNKKQQLIQQISELTDSIQKQDLLQTSIKLLANSTYGYMGNKHAPMGDDDLASSTTLTGQAVIKQAAQIYTEYLDEVHNIKQTVNDIRIYGDTDSYFSDTKITTSEGIFDAESLWNYFDNKSKHFTVFGHEVIKDINLQVTTFDNIAKQVVFKSIRHLVRHKVSKQQFNIKVGSKSIRMTGDHGCLVYRDGDLVRVAAKDIKQGDKMIIRKNV